LEMPFSNRDDFAEMQAVPRDVRPNPAFVGGVRKRNYHKLKRHVYWKADSGDHADIASAAPSRPSAAGALAAGFLRRDGSRMALTSSWHSKTAATWITPISAEAVTQCQSDRLPTDTPAHVLYVEQPRTHTDKHDL